MPKSNKMANDFQLQDSVQLLHGYTPTMTISELKDQSALCVWWDHKKNKMLQEWLPVNVLKKTPVKQPIDLSGLLRR